MLFLLEQAVIGEIVDLHRVTDSIERALSGLSGDFAALLENLVDFGQATLPLRTAVVCYAYIVGSRRDILYCGTIYFKITNPKTIAFA